MKTEEIRKMSESQIQEKIQQNKKELLNLRFQKVTELKNTSRFKTLRREIARMLTIQNEKKIGGANA